MDEVLSLDVLPLEALVKIAEHLKGVDFLNYVSTYKVLWDSQPIKELYCQKWREFKFEKLTQPSRQLNTLEYLTFLLLSEIKPIHFRVTDNFRKLCQAVIDQFSKRETPFYSDKIGWVWGLLHTLRQEVDESHSHVEGVCQECWTRDTDLGIAVYNCIEKNYDLAYFTSMIHVLMSGSRGGSIPNRGDVAVDIGDSGPSRIAQIEADFNVRWWSRFLRNLFSVSGAALIIGCHRVITDPEAVANTHLSAFLKGGIFLLMVAVVCEMQQRYDLRSSINHTLFGSSSDDVLEADAPNEPAAPPSPGTKKTQ